MWIIDKTFDCGCIVKKSDFSNDVEIEFCDKHSNEYVERIEAENAALRQRVQELGAALNALSGEQRLGDDFFDYVERKPIHASRSVGAGGSVYPFGGRETETR